MDKEEKKIRYLEFIQNIITRMAECSFKCKEFCVLIVTGLLAVYASLEKHPETIILCCLAPILIFWFIDSFYLYKERLYRDLYIDNQKISDDVDKFSLKAKAANKKQSVKKFLLAMFYSVSTIVLYGALTIGVIVFYFVMKEVIK